MKNNPYAYLEKWAKETPDAPALVFAETVYSFRNLLQTSTQLAAAMRKDGLKKGQVVLLAAPNSLLGVLLTLAAMHEAAVVAPQVGAKYNPALAADICFAGEHVQDFPKSKTIIIDQNWLVASEELVPIAPVDYPEENPTVRLLQTSGTTGDAKVVEFDFESLADCFDVSWNEQVEQSGREKFSVDRCFTLLPFSILAGSINWAAALRSGKRFNLMIGIKEIDLKMIQHYEIDTLMLSPATLADYFLEENAPTFLSKIKVLSTFGASMPDITVRKLQERWDVEIRNGMGSNESTIGFAGRLVREGDPEGLVGKILDHTTVKIVDDNLNEVPNGEVGKIAVKTKLMRSGYRNNPEATAKHFVGGYFYSGDEGYVTDDGTLYLVGRSDERMNFGGRKIDPNEVDAIIKNIPGIKDGAVFGFDQPTGIRGLAAVLILHPSYSLKKIQNDIQFELGSKRPQVLIEVASIPKTTMGKVQRIELEKQYTEEANRLSGNN
jgi:acyl-coenzyme A synthetase/AMP-(fatty) acid ligase